MSYGKGFNSNPILYLALPPKPNIYGYIYTTRTAKYMRHEIPNAYIWISDNILIASYCLP